ncbi:WD40 repeat domain-containing protein [Nocardia sp. NPDC049149]|uniref:WD40 repeat domain-containing protein n=1 Tax=Nocardia sp. NPDC049149 TaxID=3364315 RepID=UPI00371EB21A
MGQLTAEFVEARRMAPTDSTGVPVRAVAHAEVDGRSTAVAIAGGRLRVWDLESGEQLVRSGVPDPQRDSSFATLTIGRLDRNPIAVTADDAGTVQAWDLRSGKPLGEPVAELHGSVRALAAAGELLLVGRGAGATSSVYNVPTVDGSVEVWDIAARQSLRSLRHGGYTESIVVGDYDGHAVAVTGSTYAAQPLLDPDDTESELAAWDVRAGAGLGPASRLPHGVAAAPMAAGVLASDPVAVVAGGRSLRLWNLAEGREVSTITCPGLTTAMVWGQTAGGPVVLAGGGDIRPDGRNWIRLWDPRDWRLIAETSTGFGRISSCAIASDGGVIVPWGDQIQLLRVKVDR